MEKKTVKNISPVDLFVAGVGLCKSGEVIEVPTDFHNVNFVDTSISVKASDTAEPKDEPKVKIKNK